MESADREIALFRELEHVRTRSAALLRADDAEHLPTLLDVARRAVAVPAARGIRAAVEALLTEAAGTARIRDVHGAAGAGALLIELGVEGGSREVRAGARTIQAALSAGTPHDTHRKPRKRDERLRALAAAIQELDPGSMVVVERGFELDDTSPFVARWGIDARFRELLRERVGVIAVAGPPGVGKRTATRWLTDTHRPPGSEVVRVSASTPMGLQRSLISELMRLGVPQAEIFVAAPEYSLVAYMRSYPPRFVVVEEARDTQLAGLLADAATEETTVLVTCEHLLDEIPAEHHVMVRELEPPEAAELVRAILPEVDAEEAERLAEQLDHHPLAISVACGMIEADGRGDVAGFRRGLRRNLSQLLDGAPTRWPALTAIYRELLDDLRRDAPNAVAVLEQLVLMDDAPVHSAFVVSGLARSVELVEVNDQHVRALARSAVEVLRNRFLVRVTDRSFVSVPGLTRTIVADLVHDRGAEIAARAQAGIFEVVRLDRRDNPDMPLVQFLGRHASTLANVTATMRDPHKSGGLVDQVHLFCAALWTFLEAVDEEPWRVAVLVLQTATDRFAVQLVRLPDAADDVETLALSVQFDAPGAPELTKVAKGWREHKRMLLMMVAYDDWVSAEELLA